jgi:hypothetical protein
MVRARPQVSRDPLDDVATTDDIPEIAAEITFLKPEEGGRREPVNLSAGLYRPHVVVGDPSQRQAVVRDGNVIDESYLGVQFKPTSRRFEPGVPQAVVLQLMYYPRVSYDRLVPGATFTVREGAQVVAFGHVVEPREHAV